MATRGAPKAPERVNHPAHYGGGDNPYEHIRVVDAWGLNYRLGQTTKYICRAGKKIGPARLNIDGVRRPDGVLTDLRKAAWFLQSEIERLDPPRPPRRRRRVSK